MKYKYIVMKIRYIPIVVRSGTQTSLASSRVVVTLGYMLYLAIIGLHFFVSSYYYSANKQ